MFANRLTALRKNKGLSQIDLAKAAGVSRSTISMYEIGAREPDFNALNKIADCLGVSVSELIDNKAEDTTVIAEAQRRQNEEELARYLEMLRTRPEMRVLLDTVEGATKEEVEANVHFLEAMRRRD